MVQKEWQQKESFTASRNQSYFSDPGQLSRDSKLNTEPGVLISPSMTRVTFPWTLWYSKEEAANVTTDIKPQPYQWNPDPVASGLVGSLLLGHL